MSLVEYAETELRVPLTYYQRDLLSSIQTNPDGYTSHIVHRNRSHGFMMVQEIVKRYNSRGA